jgi:hypothetical protein
MLNIRRSFVDEKSGVSMNSRPVAPLPPTPWLKVETDVVKGPTLGDSPAIVMFDEIRWPVLLSSTKLPPSVHAGEQLAVPDSAIMVPATSSVMMSAFAAPKLSTRAHAAATSAALSFDFMTAPP